ncbi:hypothetical protein M972_111094 [Acetivibrio thermocellus AD2]|jgi:hypothetical protein|uniref:Uncharacterized protein n=1 Tax=Acetivibrio thermocellus AD2 TaxID=1138384 RepID=A0AB36TGK0_ACETH|nr:hypothetical protein [Acetivibrio thermocellus]ADU74116.1 hypothetical protein Clo1313_1048 [Acetivibrio thermocellus DSM 1313]ALX08054.1 hypothetical protein AD2_01059 [Acetivibrio thermocellus AD2]ANV75801.1 hypothetical protein LQRI_1060 [Acetivibrio thermocellus DSM 2360]EIC06074.1 hypothetical protein YSBL_0380 [Acetivibrio thermocellus YS]PFH02325.1 hypothetical protein M972_111094 [Acetivibrio thermocellus AD2]
MNNLYKYTKNIALFITSSLAGIILFVWIMSINLGTSVMTSGFHKKLLEKNNIYDEVQNEINNLVQSIFTDLSRQLPQLGDQQEEILAILEGSISPQMVKTNLDTIADGLFKYFNGEKSFLPDIIIDTDPTSLQSSNAAEGDSSEDTSDITNSEYVLSKIKRVNLNAILLSINRSDILDMLLFIKLIYFIMDFAPVFCALLLLLLFLKSLLLGKNIKEMLNWLFRVLMTCSILCIITAIFCLVYSYKILPGNIYMLSVAIPLKSEVLLSYIRDCFVPLFVFFTASGILMVLLAFLVVSLNKVANKFSSVNINIFKFKNFSIKHKKILKYTTIMLLLIFSLSLFCFELYSFKKEFESNNFSNLISRLTNSNSYTEVISAKDDTIYMLQIKLVDAKDNSPILGIQINVNGKTDNPEKYYNIAGETDETGTVKFTLGKGTFHLAFSPAEGSTDYILPSPFFYELKSVGTTMLTVNLSKNQALTQSTGITEIEVLDENNHPVEGIELYVDSEKNSPQHPEPTPSADVLHSASSKNPEPSGNPDRFFSVTNEEGIAVFKLPSGIYNVKFSPDKLPKDYKAPELFEINCSPNLTTRYTIRLVKSPR